jgi:RimJ/RimL family protein N-acetyltransferase
MLEGPKVALVPLDVTDVTPEYVDWFNDPVTFRFLGSKFPQTLTSVRAYVSSIQRPNFICRIVRRADGRHIGNIALQGFSPVDRRMELGIVIGDAESRGRGFGREACSLAVAFAFDHLNLHKVTAGTVAGNDAMKNVFVSLGFAIEGTLTEHYALEGRYLDVFVLGVLRRTFRPSHARDRGSAGTE